MFNTVVSRGLMAACVLLAAAGARAADDPAQKFIAQIISGAKTNSARAAKLLEAAKVLTGQPKVCAAVLEKALEFGMKSPATPAACKVAAEALDLLEAEFPDRKDEWTLKRADACRVKFRGARTQSEKQAAGRELLAALLTAAEVHEKSGEWTGAAARYREAVPVDAYLKAGNAEEIRRKLKAVAHSATITKRVAQYTASLKKDPSKTSTRVMLVKTLVVELNDPARAVEHLNEDVDQAWRTYVPLAAKQIDDLAEAACLELGEWYYKELSKTTSPTGKGVSLRRAKDYYKQFAELHTKVDIQTLRAKVALANVEKELAKLNAPATRVSSSAGKARKTFILSLGSGVTMKLVRIPAGRFLMSSPQSEKGRLPRENSQHTVTISRSFYMGVTELTQLQWRTVMGTEPWAGRDNVQSGAHNAANYLSWRDAEAFCNKLSKQTGRTVTLPTEAQWEYACRAGTKTAFSFGDDPSKLSAFAWYDIRKKDDAEAYAHPVGRKKPNAWGLYDMHGNLYEWCLDWYGETAYATSKNVDPTGPASGKARVVRGGSFKEISNWCRSSHRHMYKTLDRKPGLGFRIVVLVVKR